MRLVFFYPILVGLASGTSQPETTDTTTVLAGGENVIQYLGLGIPTDYFAKSFEEYRNGFSINGTGGHSGWLGLERIHELTKDGSKGLRITLEHGKKNYYDSELDGKKYTAIYKKFEVGPGDGYQLSVSGFNEELSNLEDSLVPSHNGYKFSAKDKHQDEGQNCSKPGYGSVGWWYGPGCFDVLLTYLVPYWGLHGEAPDKWFKTSKMEIFNNNIETTTTSMPITTTSTTKTTKSTTVSDRTTTTSTDGTTKCIPCKSVTSGPAELHGTYILDKTSDLNANPGCKDDCIYMMDGNPYCFEDGGHLVEYCDIPTTNPSG